MQKGGAGEFYSSLFSWLAIGLGQVSACLGALIHCLVKWKSHLPLQNYTVRCLLTFKHFEILKWEAILKFKSWLLFLALWVSSTWLWTLGFAKWFLIQLHEGSFFFFFYWHCPFNRNKAVQFVNHPFFHDSLFLVQKLHKQTVRHRCWLTAVFHTDVSLQLGSLYPEKRTIYLVNTLKSGLRGSHLLDRAWAAQVMSCTGSRGYG